MAFATPVIKPDYELYSPPKSPVSPNFRRQSLAASFFRSNRFAASTDSESSIPRKESRSQSTPNIKVECSGGRHRSILRSNTIATERPVEDPGKKVHFAMFAEQYTFDKKKPPLSPKYSDASDCSSPRRFSPRAKSGGFYKLFSYKENREAKTMMKQAVVANAVASAVGPLRLAEGRVCE